MQQAQRVRDTLGIVGMAVAEPLAIGVSAVQLSLAHLELTVGQIARLVAKMISTIIVLGTFVAAIT